ncbi:MAG: SUMF1/EgtB/PvdO family nonheme iron enzyme, partial [Myxococcota bacterium]
RLRMRRTASRWGWAFVLLLVGCRDEREQAEAPVSAPPPRALLQADPDADPLQPAPAASAPTAEPGQRRDIPAGTFTRGSVPGERGRDPRLEPSATRIDVGTFSIDRLPYPNDPRAPFRTSSTQAEAAAACAERGGRLCTETEWERACRGDGDRYPGSERWRPACAEHPHGCESAFGVLHMGTSVREWTASPVEPIAGLFDRGVAVRGAARDTSDPTARRCARRTVQPSENKDEKLGFRCCYGEAQAAEPIPSPGWRPTIEATTISSSRLGELFASDPALATVADGIEFFRDEAAGATVVQKGRDRAKEEFEEPRATTVFSSKPLRWRPVPGESVLLVIGRAGENSFIVALHELGEERFRLGAALVLRREAGPVAFAYNRQVAAMREASPLRRKVLWSTCWNCFGEMGNITYRSENRVVITQK